MPIIPRRRVAGHDQPAITPTRRPTTALALAVTGLLTFTGCAASSQAATTDDERAAGSSTSVLDAAIDDAIDDMIDDSVDPSEFDLFDSSVVHQISVDVDPADYDAMIDTFTATGDKEWISATITIDGIEYENVGLRLKGNSSLFGLTSSTAENPEDLPWLIRLDEFVDGQDHQGYEEIVIRSNSTETAMNEAVAQELLALAGLASQRPIATEFSVNAGESELRLAVEHPDEEWYEDHFDDDDGLLYKADSEGDYSYRGDDPEAYTDVFDQKVGDDDLEPLIEFLDFINNADDSTFSEQLAAHLDVEAFATYLAVQDLIANADDINGRGNNSYLQYDTTTDRFTVVSWDLNLAFATANVGGGGAGGPAAGGVAAGGGAEGAGVGEAPVGEAPVGEPRVGEAPVGEPSGDEVGGQPGRPTGPPDVGGRPAGPPDGAGPGDQPNVLVDRFLADDDFAALYASATSELTEQLFSSGTVDDVIAYWTDVLTSGASHLVDAATITSDARALIEYVDSVR